MLRSIGKQSAESVESVGNKHAVQTDFNHIGFIGHISAVVTSSVMQGDYVNPQERRIDESFTDALLSTRAACTAQL